MQFSSAQRTEALALVEGMAWGDMEIHISSVEDMLRLALEVTADDFARWVNELEDSLEFAGHDEFNLPDAFIDGLAPDAKLAYIARLVHTLALVYGVSEAEEGSGLKVFAKTSPAALLRGLNAIKSKGEADQEAQP
jgi:hypothetical protein